MLKSTEKKIQFTFIVFALLIFTFIKLSQNVYISQKLYLLIYIPGICIYFFSATYNLFKTQKLVAAFFYYLISLIILIILVLNYGIKI